MYIYLSVYLSISTYISINLYIYIYIYICIYRLSIYIGWTRWNGDITSKNKLFSQLVSAVAILKGYAEFVIYKCWRIFDVILRLASVILDHMQKRKMMWTESLHDFQAFQTFQTFFQTFITFRLSDLTMRRSFSLI